MEGGQQAVDGIVQGKHAQGRLYPQGIHHKSQDHAQEHGFPQQGKIPFEIRTDGRNDVVEMEGRDNDGRGCRQKSPVRKGVMAGLNVCLAHEDHETEKHQQTDHDKCS